MQWKSGARWLVSLGLLLSFGSASPAQPHRDLVVAQNTRDEFTAKDEFRQNYRLAPDAQVTIKRINGSVEIGVSKTNQAELYVVRSAERDEDLRFSQVQVEASVTQLLIEGEENTESRRSRPEVKQQVVLKLPRQVALEVTGINGNVQITALTGPLRISGINGKVTVDQARGLTKVSGINGNVSLNFAQLDPQGLRISGINGKVTLQCPSPCNADLEVTGLNGEVSTDVSKIEVLSREEDESNFQARIGKGGVPIKLSGINGSVKVIAR